MDKRYYLQFWFSGSKKNIVTDKANSVFDVKWSEVLGKYKTIIFDFDDTLDEHGGVLKNDTISLIRKLSKKDIKIAIVSNGGRKREISLTRKLKGLNSKIFFGSNKPNPECYQRIITFFRIEATNCVVIGDRVGTDLYAGFLLGIPKRILIKPYSDYFGGNKANYFYRVARFLENWVSKNKEL